MSSCNIKRVIQLNMPISWLPIKVFGSENSDITYSSKYSWSSDGVCWTNWTDKKTFDNICKNNTSDFYLRILIFDEFSELWVNSMLTDCYHISLYNENIFLESFCDNKNLFQPYSNLDCALLLQQQLSDSICCMFGIPCYYFSVSPNEDTTDYTFKEYVLHHVDSIKMLKIVVEEGELPSSNTQMTELDFDWENEWSVEIGKNDFARAFGDNVFPKNHDFVYVPMMKRMFDVNSAYDEKNEGLMWRSTTWKLMLQKYNESTNVDSTDFSSVIDSFIINNYDNVFGSIEQVEQERTSGATQVIAPKFASVNTCELFLEDSVRASITLSEKKNIINKQINNGSMIVARNLYDFKDSESSIIYQNKYCGEDGVLSFIISPKAVSGQYEHSIISIGDFHINLSKNSQGTISLSYLDNNATLIENKFYLVICKWNRGTFSSSLEVYENKAPENTAKWQIRPEMYKFDFVNRQSIVSNYNNILYMKKKELVSISPAYCYLTNIKLFENFLDQKEAIKESLKYTTTSKSCLINDLARPFESGTGYAVR